MHLNQAVSRVLASPKSQAYKDANIVTGTVLAALKEAAGTNAIGTAMKAIETRAREHLQNGNDHCAVCNHLADEFELWETVNPGQDRPSYFAFPIWLSRVVEGVMNDIAEESLACVGDEPRASRA